MDRCRVSLVTHLSTGPHSMPIEVREYKHRETGEKYPAVDIGDFCWQPNDAQLFELRDKIDAYLQRSRDSEPEQAREAKSK